MRIVADRDKCEGLGMCEATSHRYFEVGEDDTVDVLDDSPAEADLAEVKAAVAACPVSALSLRD